MNHKTPPERTPSRAQAQPLDRAVMQALNRRAHAEGQRHAEAVKRSLLADLERLRAGGATRSELLALVAGGAS